MNFEQLANLIKAGFTEDQIRSIGSIMGTGTNTGTGTGTDTPGGTLSSAALSTPTPTETPGGTLSSAALSAPTPTPTETPGGTLSSAALSAPSQSPEPKESETVSLLKEMLGMMQRGNINTMGTGTIPEQTGADVLAEILNPTPKTK